MFPLFTYPLALVGLLGVPLLVGIYLLRNRFRRQPVSSLMLWLDPREALQGGTRIRRLQTPLLFLLEMLAILLLVLAAAEPRIRTTQTARPLVVVLDDSFSMLAGGNDSARQEGIRAVLELMRTRPPSTIRFVLAGETPQILGEPVADVSEVEDVLKGWHCRSAAFRVDEALALAADLAGDPGLLLVLTDHPPEANLVPAKGRLQWWSFGRPRSNIAFVGAARTARDGSDRCLLEIANLSENRARSSLTIEVGGEILQPSLVALEPRQSKRIILSLKPDAPALRASLDAGELAIDKTVVLLPTASRPVRVANRVGEKDLRQALTKAIKSVRNATLTDTRPEVIFTDAAEDVEASDAWVVRMLVEKDADAYSGPFVMDRTHPLTDGLSLRGVIWGAGKTEELDGNPVVMAGNIRLLTDTETQTEAGFARHELRWRLRPDLSTLQDSPDWPILIWNILNWRTAQAIGPNCPNIRLGETVTVTFPTPPREKVRLTTPGGETSFLSAHGRTVMYKPEEVGSYAVKGDESEFAFAVNALNRDESDWTGCAPGKWGDWLDETSLRLEYRSVVWAVLLVLLGVLTLHLILAAGKSQARP
jgi:Aerotolerance regulator N-terminal